MGTAWAVAFVLGLLVPAFALVGSSVVVWRLARRLQRMGGGARPAWQFVLGHAVLVVVADLGGGGLVGFFLPFPGALAALAMTVLPLYLYRTVRRAGHRGGSPPSQPPPPLGSRRAWGIAVLIAATGVAWPWAVGLGVKVYLDSVGRPTLPVSGFLDPAAVPVLLFLTFGLWAFPFVILASAVVVPWRIGFGADPEGRRAMLPIWLAYVLGVGAAVPVFVGVFWEFDSMLLLVPVGVSLVPPMAVGYLAGWWIVRRRHGGRGAPGNARGYG